MTELTSYRRRVQEFYNRALPCQEQISIPGHGTTRFDVGQFAGLPANSVGIAVVQSDQPVVGVTEIKGNGQFALSPPSSSWSSPISSRRLMY